MRIQNRQAFLLGIFFLVFFQCTAYVLANSIEGDYATVEPLISPYADDIPGVPKPLPPIITDDGETTQDNTQLHATWVPGDSLDIIEYKYAIGTTPGATDIVDWTSIGSATEVTHTSLFLVHFQAYYFSVKSKNINNKWSRVGYSDGITIDTQPPQGTIIINNDEPYTNSTSVTLTLSASDVVSGMGEGAQMQFSNDNIQWSPPETYTTTKDWTLTDGDGQKTAYVKFKDVVGNWSEPFSDNIFFDNTPPTIPVVTDDGATTNDSTQLHATWSSFDIDF